MAEEKCPQGWSAPTDSSERVHLLQQVGEFLLEQLREICEAHDIPYYLQGGNLLGAFRSQGWLDWDDDVDVLMHRDDYERLRDLGPAVWPASLELSDQQLRAKHTSAVPRLIYLDSRIDLVERFGITAPERQRAALDIFILDVPPSSDRARSWWLTSTSILQRSIALRSTTLQQIVRSREPLLSRAAAAVSFGVSRALPLKSQKRRLHRISARYQGHASEDLFVLNHSARVRRAVLKAAWFQAVEWVQFAGRRYPAPQVEAYLAAIYGPDFKTPPPADQRVKLKLTFLAAKIPSQQNG